MSLHDLGKRSEALVNGWRVDPIDQWRQAQRQAQFLKPAATTDAASVPKHLAHLVLSEAIEQDTVDWLQQALEVNVTPTAWNEPWDALIDNCLTVEIKGSLWHLSGGRGRYQFNIRQHKADMLICVARNGRDHRFIMPMAAASGNQSITIRRQDIAGYRGKWADYLGRVDLLEAMLRAARHCPRPLLLTNED